GRPRSATGRAQTMKSAGGSHARQPGAEGGGVKKVVTATARRDVVGVLRDSFSMSERRACRTIGISRSTLRYESARADATELRARLRELAQARPRFGYRRLHVLLRREGR